MKKFKVTHGDKTYKVTAKDADEARAAVLSIPENDIEDDRLSPMTYKKLKELGYSHEDWKDLSQEQANKIVAQESNNTATKQNSESKPDYDSDEEDFGELISSMAEEVEKNKPAVESNKDVPKPKQQKHNITENSTITFTSEGSMDGGDFEEFVKEELGNDFSEKNLTVKQVVDLWENYNGDYWFTDDGQVPGWKLSYAQKIKLLQEDGILKVNSTLEKQNKSAAKVKNTKQGNHPRLGNYTHIEYEYNGQNFSATDRPEAGTMQITETHPYDNTDYNWAKGTYNSDGTISFNLISNGKRVGEPVTVNKENLDKVFELVKTSNSQKKPKIDKT